MAENNIENQHFMVLGSARTGSNLLMSLLTGHEKIKMYGELFNLDVLAPSILQEALDDPLSYLKKRVYVSDVNRNRSFGFKMFYDHLKDEYFKKVVSTQEAVDEIRENFISFNTFVDSNYLKDDLYSKFKSIWEFLINDRDLKIIHLKRRNKLHSLISLKVAFLTNKWVALKSDQRSNAVFNLDFEECEIYFNSLDSNEKEHDALFENHDKIEVTYEELTEDMERELKRIFSFLNIPHQSVSTIMKKQIVAHPSETISNYYELKERFEKTKWSEFFI